MLWRERRRVTSIHTHFFLFTIWFMDARQNGLQGIMQESKARVRTNTNKVSMVQFGRSSRIVCSHTWKLPRSSRKRSFHADMQERQSIKIEADYQHFQFISLTTPFNADIRIKILPWISIQKFRMKRRRKKKKWEINQTTNTFTRTRRESLFDVLRNLN